MCKILEISRSDYYKYRNKDFSKKKKMLTQTWLLRYLMIARRSMVLAKLSGLAKNKDYFVKT